jgi:hypothetical protein
MSTEDLADPRAPSGPPQDRQDTASAAPAYPGESTTAAGTPAQETAPDETPQLMGPQDEEAFRARWQEIQSEFVDEPRDAVHDADELVADVMQQLAATFADHKQDLEGQWTRGEDVNTEELRTALQHYRSFFNRLLTT